jgi:translation initiation factor 2B subunit (eIF-2B alpha/beta/delta family)
MSSEEEVGNEEKGEGVELVKEEVTEEPETAGAAAEEVEAEEEAVEYDITSPDLLEAMLEMADLLENVSQGKMSVEEAVAIVKSRIESMVASSVKQPKRSRRSRSAAARKQTSRKRAKKASTSSKKGGRKRRKKSGGESAGASQ